MKTLGRFVLINNDTKKQILLDWNQKNMHKTSQNVIQTQFMPYSDRKKIVSDLHPLENFKNAKSRRNSINKNIRTSASTNKITPYVYTNPERQNATISSFHRQSHHTLYRTRSFTKNLQRTSKGSLPKVTLRQDQIVEKFVQNSNVKGNKIICALTMRRSGLRYKLSHQFYTYSPTLLHERLIQQIKQKQFKDFPHKPIYLFHLSKQPINKVSNDLAAKQYIIFADLSPKFNLPFEIQMKLFQQASAIQDLIKKCEQDYECNNQQRDLNFIENNVAQSEDEHSEQINQGKQMRRIELEINNRKQSKKKGSYEWQKIGEINQYVEKLISNPQYAKTITRDHTEQDDLDRWFALKFSDQQKKIETQQKNPFFDIQTHFPKQTADQKGLEATLQKMQLRSTTQNIHQIKHRPVENMMEKIKKQKEKAVALKQQEQKRIKTIGYKSGKEFFRELDEKNTPLVEQNIPYMMAKYGITRAEAYNLYNLYKSLQKISAMRLFDKNEFRNVKDKGIDRETFDQGLKGLEINPGEEVIRNICYFPEFIKWEEFIKIISISLQKTTQSKLEAILQGIGSSSSGSLSEKQISIMIGGSLHKIFGREYPQLRIHFVKMAMKNLDCDNSGTIDCQQLKSHVLKRNIEDLDLISYLILNS